MMKFSNYRVSVMIHLQLDPETRVTLIFLQILIKMEIQFDTTDLPSLSLPPCTSTTNIVQHKCIGE